MIVDGSPFLQAPRVDLVIGDPLRVANGTADTLKKLLAALRLPDEVTGTRPQRRGPEALRDRRYRAVVVTD